MTFFPLVPGLCFHFWLCFCFSERVWNVAGGCFKLGGMCWEYLGRTPFGVCYCGVWV